MTTLRVIDRPADGVSYWDAEPGDMWPCPHHVVEGRAPCWVIRMPDGAYCWHTNMTESDSGNYWTVTGEAPKITVSPSINIGPEIWHGHIVDGEMTP